MSYSSSSNVTIQQQQLEGTIASTVLYTQSIVKSLVQEFRYLVKHLYATTHLSQHTGFDCLEFLPYPLLSGACGLVAATDGSNAETLLLGLLTVPSWRYNGRYSNKLERLRPCSCSDAQGFAACQLQWLDPALRDLRLPGPRIG